MTNRLLFWLSLHLDALLYQTIFQGTGLTGEPGKVIL